MDVESVAVESVAVESYGLRLPEFTKQGPGRVRGQGP